MSTLVARHALSFANDDQSPAFGSAEASLKPEGKQQSQLLGVRLITDYGINPSTTPAAVAELNRSRETAAEAGFLTRVRYSSLNEVPNWKDIPNLMAMLLSGELPAAAIERAEALLSNPPIEPVWISHGLVIAGMCKVLGVAQEAVLIPEFCEIRKLPI